MEKTRILVIEDDATLSEGIAMALEGPDRLLWRIQRKGRTCFCWM